MNSVIVCAVLVLSDNAGSFVMNRRSADLEQSVLDFYRPMESKMQHAENNDSNLENYTEETEEVYEYKSDNEITPKDYMDFFLNPDQYASHMSMKDGSRNDNENIIPKEEIDEDVLTAIWGPSPASLIDRGDGLANTTFGEGNETTFNTEDRFLSETLLRTSWEKNLEPDEEVNRKKSLDNLEPDKGSKSGRGSLNAISAQRSFSHRDHSTSTPENSASTKHLSTLLVLTLACFSLVS